MRKWNSKPGKALLWPVLCAAILFITPAQLFAAGEECGHLFGGPEGEAFQDQVDVETGTSRVGGNEVLILDEATSDYELRTDLRDRAEDHIHVYTLLVENNRTGVDTATQLATKAILEEAQVNFLFHPISQIFDSKIAITTAMRILGVNVHYYLPLNQGLVGTVLIGCHKKLLVVDSPEFGLEAVVGGRNIGDNYFADLPEPEPGAFNNIWRDTDIHVTGPAIYDMVDDYIQRFNEQVVIGQPIGCPPEPAPCRYYPFVNTPDPDADVEMRVIQNEPDDNDGEGLFQINYMYEVLLDQAQRSIDIETPYFIPQEPLRSKLLAAANRGVRVRILTNSQDSNDLGAPLFYASSYYWRELLDAGAEIFIWDLPRPEGHEEIYRTMHSKIVNIDSCLFMPGSWNFDGRSFNHENEYAFPITDEAVALEATSMYEGDLAVEGVTQVDRKWFRDNFSLMDYVLAWFFALFSAFL